MYLYGSLFANISHLGQNRQNVLFPPPLFISTKLPHLIYSAVFSIHSRLLRPPVYLGTKSTCEWNHNCCWIRSRSRSKAIEADKNNKKVIFKIFTDCTSHINNIQMDNAKDLDVVMPMYDLIEYSDIYSKTSGYQMIS